LANALSPEQLTASWSALFGGFDPVSTSLDLGELFSGYDPAAMSADFATLIEDLTPAWVPDLAASALTAFQNRPPLRRCYPSTVTLIALTVNGLGDPANCCYAAESETSFLLIGANSHGHNNVFGISRFVQ
jgi:hypothetical protein